MEKTMPPGRKLVLEDEQSCATSVLIIREHVFQRLLRRVSQNLSALARGVFKVEHNIGEGVEIEGISVLRHVNAPARDRTCTFERQITFVAEVQVEHAA